MTSGRGDFKNKIMALIRNALTVFMYDICLRHKDCDEKSGDSITVNLNNLPAAPEKLASAYTIA